jgi:protein phosphatase
MNIFSVGMTDKGARRENNEDAFVILPNQQYCSVADGMGGAAAGEVASDIFIKTVTELFTDLQPQSEDELNALVRKTFQLGNDRIITCAKTIPQYQGMGCTAEVITFYGDRYIVGHVGDSRTYLFRDGGLRQITKDHSLVQHQVDQGMISVAEAKNHAMKNVVLRALGIEQELSLDIIRGRALSGDLFLLCSDGLSDMLDDEGITQILAGGNVLSDKVKLLIQGAIAAGGRDNVTVVLCQAQQ